LKEPSRVDVNDFPTESAAWAEVEKQHLQTQINKSEVLGRVTFADLAQHYITHELGEQTEAVDPKAYTTIAGYKRILKNRERRANRGLKSWAQKQTESIFQARKNSAVSRSTSHSH
jgi:hypothetical protein